MVTKLQAGVRRDGKKQWYSDLSARAVRSVYLGCRMPEKNRKEILDSITSQEWKELKQFEMRIHPTNFSVEPVHPQELKVVSREDKERFEATQAAAREKFLDQSEREWMNKVQ